MSARQASKLFPVTLVSDTLAWAGYDVLEEPERVLTAVKEAGFAGIDLPGAPDRVDAERMRELAARHGLDTPELLCAWSYFHAGESRDLCGDSEDERRRGVEYVTQAIDLAHRAGARMVNVCSPQPPVPQVPFPRMAAAKLRANFIASMRPIAQHALDLGIDVVFEPLNRYEAFPGVVSTLAEGMSVIDELGFPNLGLQPDVFHMNISEANTREALRAARGYIRHFHLNETNHRGLGEGHADLEGIFRVLLEMDYAGYLAVYMPLISQEVFQSVARGYGAAGGGGNSPAPPLEEMLHEVMRRIREIESNARAGFAPKGTEG